MKLVGYGLVVALSALLVACASDGRLPANEGGIALTIEDDEDALEDAIDEAAEHCRRHDRFAVLQAVSEIRDDELLVTFNCVESRGGGVVVTIDDDDTLEEASDRADDYCDRFGRDAVLQSVFEVGDERAAAFSCV